MLTQYCRSLLAALLTLAAALALAPAAQAISIQSVGTTFTGDHSVVDIELTESGGDIVVNVSVDLSENHGDLRAVYLNIADDSLLDGISIDGVDVTDFDFDTINLGNGSNLNGADSPCPCDIGVEIGTPGIGLDDLHETTFTISHDTVDLLLSQFTAQTFGIRVTSVGPEECFDGSAKLKGVFPAEVPEPGSALLVGLGLGLVGLARRPRS